MPRLYCGIWKVFVWIKQHPFFGVGSQWVDNCALPPMSVALFGGMFNIGGKGVYIYILYILYILYYLFYYILYIIYYIISYIRPYIIYYIILYTIYYIIIYMLYLRQKWKKEIVFFGVTDRRAPGGLHCHRAWTGEWRGWKPVSMEKWCVCIYI